MKSKLKYFLLALLAGFCMVSVLAVITRHEPLTGLTAAAQAQSRSFYEGKNMTGAGSVIATNYVYNVAKPDGLTVGMPTQQIYMGEFVGNSEVKFQVRKFLWIGSPDRNPAILYMRADAPYKTVEDIRRASEPPKCGATGTASSGYYIPLLLEETLGMKFNIITAISV